MDFNSVEDIINEQLILSKVSEYNIFKFYCKNFIDIDKPFCSELRMDKNPDCRIYVNSNNQLKYKDFATGDNFNCFNYVKVKFNCSYYDALKIVYNDFGLGKINIDFDPKILVSNDQFKLNFNNKTKEKSIITIQEQSWNITDYNYWNQYGITFDLLNEYNVFSCKNVYLTKGINRYITEYKKSNPVYAYRFTNDGEYHYKIYKPLEQDKRYKWLFNGSSNDIEGYDQLPLSGEYLILTKSLKDCMCYNLIGYSAISLQGEGNKLGQDLVDKLLKRFNKIIINYDNDERGIEETNKLIKQYGFNHFYIDKFKDLSDHIKNKGLISAKRIINAKIRTYRT